MASQAFTEAFALMKTRGGDTICLEEIFSFTDTLAPPPERNKVRAIYNEFDADGSGDIDSEEFLGLCQALEKLTNMSVDDMADCYSTSCYKRLFALVDDGKLPLDQATISKDELKVFLDSSALQVSSADIVNIFKEYAGELGFADFKAVVKRLIRGQSISTVLKVFEDGKERQRRNRLQAMKIFEDPAAVAKKKAKDEAAAAAAAAAASGAGGSKSPGPGRAGKASRTQTSEEVFAECFTLMDSRGGGVLSLDAIYEFCEALPNPPSQATVRKLYNQFDEDGSGDIDSEEFLGFCKALENVTSLSTAAMCQHYSEAMYRRLFELVDEGGDGNGGVGKDELKGLLEAISPLLSSKFTAADVFALVKDIEGELSFDDFCDVVKKVTVGKSISQVVTAFEEAMRRRKAAKHFAIQKFEGKDGGGGKGGKGGAAAGDTGPSLASGERLCFSCMEKEQQLRELQQEVEILRAELAQLKGGAAAATQEKSIRELMSEDDFHGNPLSSIHAIQDLSSSAFYKKFPELIKPALHFVQSQRVATMTQFFESRTQGSTMQTDTIAREMNEEFPHVFDLQRQLQAVLDPILGDFLMSMTLNRQLLQQLAIFNETRDLTPVSETFDLLQSYRANMKTMRADASWIIDAVVEKRSALATKALCIAPYTSKSAMITSAVERVELDTQLLLDVTTVIMMHGSDQLTDVEINAKRVIHSVKKSVEQSELDSMNDVLNKVEQHVSKQQIDALFDTLKRSIDALKRNVSVSSSTKRDKAVMTMPMVDAAIMARKNAAAHQDAVAAAASAANANAPGGLEVTVRSQSPRMRTKTAKPRDTVAHVDRILDQYIHANGVAVPPNFQRTEPGSNTFQFGTRKIELIPVDKFAVVKVGGGYLLFDEFCNKYCAAENRKFVVQEQRPETEIIRSYMATPRLAMTPRSVGGSAATPRTHSEAARTPRTLVRSGNKLNIV